ncbi:MAG: YcaO-related McrA-glycine thioamidation protein [Methanoculleaceae archaeon]
MHLGPCKKRYSDGTQRVCPPDETLKRALAAQQAAGITRITEITGLDRVGIPVFSAERPSTSPGAVSVYSGKGATPVAAHVSALMEGIERYSAEVLDRNLLLSRYEEVISRAIDPAEHILPAGTEYRGIPLLWTEGTDLTTGDKLLVCANEVYHPLPRGQNLLFRTHTNGLASGNTLEEAVFHALAELIERDAWSLAEAIGDMGPRITGVDSGPEAEMLARFEEAGVEITLRDLTSDIGIPTIAAVADDTVTKDPALLTVGMGTHTSARVALSRALTEVAQSRLTQIHGAREDTKVAEIRRRMGYERAKRINRHWFEYDEEISFSEIKSCDTDDFYTDIQLMMDALKRQGLGTVIGVDLTRPETGIPVVRLVVPGIEMYAMDPERKGDRCREQIRKRRRRRRER